MDSELNLALTMFDDEATGTFLDEVDALLFDILPFSSLNKAINESNYTLFKTEFLKLTPINLEKTIEAINHVVKEKPHSMECGIIAWLVLTAISYFDNDLSAEQLYDNYNEQIAKCQKLNESLKLSLQDKFMMGNPDGSANKNALRRAILTKILALFNQTSTTIAYHFFYQLYNDSETLSEHERKGLSDLYLEILSSQEDIYTNISNLIKNNKHPTEVAFKLQDLNCLKLYYNHSQYYDWLLAIKETDPKTFHVSCAFDDFFVSIFILNPSDKKTETYYQQREKMQGVDGWKNYQNLMSEVSTLETHDEITQGIKQLAAFHHVTTEAAKVSIIQEGLKPSEVVQKQQSSARITTPHTSVTSTVFGSALPGDIVIHRPDLSTLIRVPIEDSMRLNPNLTWTTPHEVGYALGREKVNSVIFSGKNGNYTIMTILFLYNEKKEREIHYHFYYKFRNPQTLEFNFKHKLLVEAFNDCVYRGNLHDIITARFYIMLNRLKHKEDLSVDSPYDCAFQNPEYAKRIAAHLVSRRTHELRYDTIIPIDERYITNNIQHNLSNWLNLCRKSITSGDAHAFDDLRTNTPKPFLHANYAHHGDPFVTCFKTAVIELCKLALLPSFVANEDALITIVEKIVTEGFSSDGPGNAVAGTIPLLLRENFINIALLDSSLYMVIDILALPIFSERLKALIIGYIERNTYNHLLVDWLTLCCNQASLKILTQGDHPSIQKVISYRAGTSTKPSLTQNFNDPAISINGTVILNVFNLIQRLEKGIKAPFSNITQVSSLCHLLMINKDSTLNPSTIKPFRYNNNNPTPFDLLTLMVSLLLKFNNELRSVNTIFNSVIFNTTNTKLPNSMEYFNFSLGTKIDIISSFKAKKLREEKPIALENINAYLLSEYDKVENGSMNVEDLKKLLFWFIESRDLKRLMSFIALIKLLDDRSYYSKKVGTALRYHFFMGSAALKCPNEIVSRYENDASIVEDPDVFENIIQKILHEYKKTFNNTSSPTLSEVAIKAINLKVPEKSYAALTLKQVIAYEASFKSNTYSAILYHFNHRAQTEGLQALNLAYESCIFRQLILSLYINFDDLISSIIHSPDNLSLSNINLCFEHLKLIQEKTQTIITENDIHATLIQQIKTPELLMGATEPEQAQATPILEHLTHLLNIIKSILSFPKYMADPEYMSLCPVTLGDSYEKVKNISDPALLTKLITIAIPIAREHDPSITDNLVLSYLNLILKHCRIDHNETSIAHVLDSILSNPRDTLDENKAAEFGFVKKVLLPDISDDEALLSNEISRIMVHLKKCNTIDITLILLDRYKESFAISNKQNMGLFSALLLKAFRDCNKNEGMGWQLGNTAKAIHAFLSTPKITEYFYAALASSETCSTELRRFLSEALCHCKHSGEFLREFLNIFVQPFFPEQKLPRTFIFHNNTLVRDPSTLLAEQVKQGLLIYIFDDDHEAIQSFTIHKELFLFFITNNIDAFNTELEKLNKSKKQTYFDLQYIIKNLIIYPISKAQEVMLKLIPEVFKNNVLFFRQQHGLLEAIKYTPDEVQKKLFEYYYPYLPETLPEREIKIDSGWYAQRIGEVPDAIKQDNPKKRGSEGNGSSAKRRRSSSSSAFPFGLFSTASSSAAAAAASSINPNSMFSTGAAASAIYRAAMAAANRAKK